MAKKITPPKPKPVLSALRALWSYGAGSGFLIMLIPAPNGREFLSDPLAPEPYGLATFLVERYDIELDTRDDMEGCLCLPAELAEYPDTAEDIARVIARHCHTEAERVPFDDLMSIAEELQKARRQPIRRQQV